jgi:hypothetical protein
VNSALLAIKAPGQSVDKSDVAHTLAASPGEREGIGELRHVLGQVDSANSTARDNAARPIPLLAWTEMPLLKATM